MEDQYKATRRAFIAFVQWYNATQPAWTLERKEHVRQLHEMWKVATKDSDMKFFMDMKEHHTGIATRELVESTENGGAEWKAYIEAGLTFRTKYLMPQAMNNPAVRAAMGKT